MPAINSFCCPLPAQDETKTCCSEVGFSVKSPRRKCLWLFPNQWRILMNSRWTSSPPPHPCFCHYPLFGLIWTTRVCKCLSHCGLAEARRWGQRWKLADREKDTLLQWYMRHTAESWCIKTGWWRKDDAAGGEPNRRKRGDTQTCKGGL